MSRCLLTEVRSGCVNVTTVLKGRASDCILIDSDGTQLYIGVGLVDCSLRRVNAEGEPFWLYLTRWSVLTLPLVSYASRL